MHLLLRAAVTDSFRVSANCLPPVMALRVAFTGWTTSEVYSLSHNSGCFDACEAPSGSHFTCVSNVRQVTDSMISPCASWAHSCLGHVWEQPMAVPAPHHYDPNLVLVNFPLWLWWACRVWSASVSSGDWPPTVNWCVSASSPSRS